MKGALVSWSGGKDSCYAAMLAQQQGYTVKGFLNILNAEGETSRAHGIPPQILKQQAAAAGLPLQMVAASWQKYEQKFTDALQHAKGFLNISHVVFGDIDLEEHRAWEEKICDQNGLTAVLPLWKKNRKKLVLQMIDEGMQMVIVSCNVAMGARFIGKTLNNELVAELESLGIDPCGEEGEFHTLVTHCKMFQKPFNVIITDAYLHNDFWYAHLQPA
jgi:diphthine-ammonia ligase